MKAPLYLIDSYALIYRSYFAFMTHPLRNRSGENISALYGYARLISLLLERAASCNADIRIAAVFDSRGPTFRKKKYPEYKATRQKAPPDLHSQVPKVEEFLKALGISVLYAEGFEADDIIATLAERCRKEGRECCIISSDKDLLQLVGNGIYQLRPVKNQGTQTEEDGTPAMEIPGLRFLPNYEPVGPGEVKTEWGVPPEKILDLLSLTGDSSDNVPGVKGVGEKTALKLMLRYGSLDEIYHNIAAIEGTVGKKLAADKENAYLSRDLITLIYDVPLEIQGIDDFSLEKLNRNSGAQLLLREEIPSVAKQIAGNREETGEGGETQTEKSRNKTENRDSEGIGDSAENTESIQRAKSPFSLRPVKEITPDPSLLGDGVYTVITAYSELEEFLKKAKDQGFFALDFETDSLDAWHAHPVGISLALRPKEAYYLPLFTGDWNENLEMTNSGDYLKPSLVKELLSPLLSDPAVTIIAHNAKYDYEVSRGWGLDRWKAKIWDTMVAAWLYDSDRGSYSLDALSASYFNYTAIPFTAVVPKGGNFADVPLETACRYSAEDADLCIRMKSFLEPKLEAMNMLSLFNEIEMPLLPVLAEMEGRGIKIQGDHLKKYGVEISSELNGIEAETWKLVGHEFNLSSPKQLQTVLFTERRLKPTKKTKTGWSTDVAVLEELAREDRVPELLLRHRTLSKLKSTYIDALAGTADSQGRIHTSFIQTGTATGRLSSREPNLQNIPIRDESGRRIREAFIAGEGKMLISADYSQIELVVLAHLSGDKNLADAFNEGKDVHTRTAALIFGIKEQDVDATQRRIAKVINFGIMYGMSSFRLSNQLKIGRKEASDFIKAYFNTYCGIKNFIEKLIAETEKTGFVSTIFGRRRAIPTINSANKTEKAAAERVAMNTPIQGSAADIVKKAMIDLDKALDLSTGRGGEASPPASNLRFSATPLSGEQCPPQRPHILRTPAMLLQVHDELIIECQESDVEETITIVRSVMENAVKLSVPLRVSVESGKRWGDFH
ncbi:MAG: DNA polymerase I [Spirochaetaceae bacterium]|jgi:DNA polymerase-1|nr:DNA polymerase I [Spirochaetaceae bacterium]